MSPEFTNLFEVFHPYAVKQIKRVQDEGVRFVHYTTADAAFSILKNAEVWMRSSSCMVDFREVEYGLECWDGAYRSKMGGELRASLDGMFDGFSDEFQDLFEGWDPHLRRDTYLTCFSEQDRSEDEHGRLSMWRAFGAGVRVALVFNNKPFMSSSNALSVYSSPVAYLSPKQFDAEFATLAGGIATNSKLLMAQGKDSVMAHLFQVFRYTAMCTKHPGFREEREWRIMYSPSFESSTRVVSGIQIIGGVPQRIYKIPLRDFPEDGLEGVEVPKLLERIIIGPTQYPQAVFDAFRQLLTDVGVQDPARKIRISDIPLRTPT